LITTQHERELRALEQLRDKRRPTRLAALQQLEGAASREAVQGVLAAIPTLHSESLDNAAIRTLQTCQHPGAGKLMVTWVQRALGHQELSWGVRVVLHALEGRRSPAIARLALSLLDDYQGTAARVLLNSANRAQLHWLAANLRNKKGYLFAAAVESAFRLSKDPFAELSPLFTARDRNGNLGTWRIREVLENLLKHRERIDDQWQAFLLSALQNDPSLTVALAPWFAARRDHAAIPALLQAARSGNEDIRYAAIEALGKLKAPEALDAIFDCLWLKDLRWTVIANAAKRIPGSAEKLRRRLDCLKRPQAATHQPARELLTVL
jgi:HEAT repeat protein